MSRFVKSSVNNKVRTQKLVAIAMLAALVVVLQLFASAIPAGNANLAFSLVPIILGAVLFGPFAGAFLGLTMGVVVSITVIGGFAGGLSAAMYAFSPFLTIFLCLLKSTVAGTVAGLVAKLLANKGKTFLAIVSASIICPTTNTAIFCFGLLTLYINIRRGRNKKNLFF